MMYEIEHGMSEIGHGYLFVTCPFFFVYARENKLLKEGDKKTQAFKGQYAPKQETARFSNCKRKEEVLQKWQTHKQQKGTANN